MTRLQLAAWLIGHTRALLAPLTVSVVARIVHQLLGVGLLAIAVAAVGRAASGEEVAVWPLVGWLAALALVKAALRYVEHYAGHWVAFTALQRLRELFFQRLIPQAPAGTTGRAGAELTERATRDIDRVEVFFAHTIPPAVSAVVVPAIALTWLGVTVDGRLAGLIACFVGMMLIVPIWSSRAGWRAAHRVAEARGALAARLGDDVQGVREVLAFEAQGARREALDRQSGELARARSAAARIRSERLLVGVLLQAFSIIVPLAAGSAAGLPAQSVALALAVAVGLWVPVRGIEGFMSGLDAAFAATDRIRTVIDAAPLVQDPEQPLRFPDRTEIEFDMVAVRHPDSDQVTVRGVTARIEHGSWSYVVGVSGSGKSTLASLLVRAIDPENGAVRIGGVDARLIAVTELRRGVAFVPQHPTLVSGTVAENLRLAAPEAADEQLLAALEMTALAEWAASLPQGWDTPVRAHGVSVSGGQLQRLALARALVADPAVLVLDEALSQLDEATAVSIRAAITVRRPGLTVLEVTHRADLIPDDAEVLVIDRGRLVEAGAAGRLRAELGAFTRLEMRGA